jgi:hypothetical protein
MRICVDPFVIHLPTSGRLPFCCFCSAEFFCRSSSVRENEAKLKKMTKQNRREELTEVRKKGRHIFLKILCRKLKNFFFSNVLWYICLGIWSRELWFLFTERFCGIFKELSEKHKWILRDEMQRGDPWKYGVIGGGWRIFPPPLVVDFSSPQMGGYFVFGLDAASSFGYLMPHQCPPSRPSLFAISTKSLPNFTFLPLPYWNGRR